MMSYYGGGHTLHPDATAAQRAEIREITLRGTRSNLLHTGVVNWENGHAYFFKADRYIRYDLQANHAEPGYPAPIVDAWEIPFRWNIDAGFVAGDRACFFSGLSYVEFDLKKDALDPACLVGGYPPLIAENIGKAGPPPGRTGRSTPPRTGTTARFTFFPARNPCGTIWQLDVATQSVPGRPRKITAGQWPGLVWE